MAKQVGFLNLEQGSLGDTTFAKTKVGYTAHIRKSLAKGRWDKDPQFARSRENASEFGITSTAARLLNKPCDLFFGSNEDIIAYSRLRAYLVKVVKTDQTSSSGKRNVLQENAHHLVGFDLNPAASLRTVFNTRFTVRGNRDTGELGVSIPSFIPSQRIKAPKGTSHFRISVSGSEVDFQNKNSKFKVFETEMIPFDDTATGDMDVTLELHAASNIPLFLYLGLSFWNLGQGDMYPVAQYKLNPACIVNVY